MVLVTRHASDPQFSNINPQVPLGLKSVFLTSLHVWLTFGTDRELQNILEIGKFPPEKV